LTYQTVLEVIDSSDLVTYLAQREVLELGYKSVRDQNKFYSDKFDIRISEREAEMLALIRGKRNLLVHTGGVVTAEFVRIHGSQFGDIGASLLIDIEEWDDAQRTLEIIAHFLCECVIEKFARGTKGLGDPYLRLHGVELVNGSFKLNSPEGTQLS
jgi:hypothetical protein